MPSVTVRLRAKLAPEVARRLESFSACEGGDQRPGGACVAPAGSAHLVRGAAGQQVLRQRGLGLGRGEEDGGQRGEAQSLRKRAARRKRRQRFLPRRLQQNAHARRAARAALRRAVQRLRPAGRARRWQRASGCMSRAPYRIAAPAGVHGAPPAAPRSSRPARPETLGRRQRQAPPRRRGARPAKQTLPDSDVPGRERGTRAAHLAAGGRLGAADGRGADRRASRADGLGDHRGAVAGESAQTAAGSRRRERTPRAHPTKEVDAMELKRGNEEKERARVGR